MLPTTRRTMLASGAALAASSLIHRSAGAAAAKAVTPPVVKLSWLGGENPLVPVSVAWGVPWPRGAVARKAQVLVNDGAGRAVPAQSWPMAYWPDGSIKWTGLAIAADARTSDLTVSVGSRKGPAPARPLTVVDAADSVQIDTGLLKARINKSGQSLIASLVTDGREVARDGRLIAVREDRSQYDSQGVLREEQFVSRISKVTVEQSGPVRAVVHIEGAHASADRQWLAFSVRFYFTAGLASIRMVHSFIYDGDQNVDFIKGLGLAFSTPFREELQNRHVRFATGKDNVFSEPVLMAPGFRPARIAKAPEYQRAQLLGQRMPDLSAFTERERTGMIGMPVWDSFKITQLEADSWGLYKRTNAKSSWVRVTSGNRARGLAFLGDVTGGLAIGVKRFWQKHPAAFEITNATTEVGELKVWFWSPDAPAMDMRHYSTTRYDADVTYEDARSITRADSNGCANTTELTIWATPDTPGPDALTAMTRTGNESPLLICTPEHYHATDTLGFWSLPGTQIPGISDADLKSAEAQLDRAFAFYGEEVERRRWYGFWDYGDWRRTYDPIRHQWRYDIGGHGWNATELTPNLWLWFGFLRSGRADLFRAAEDMTRNTMEVNVYHSGTFAGLGNRHNVTHWGDGAKEPRISQAHLKRFHYYLTTDERTGDLMRELLPTLENSVGLHLNDNPEPGREITIRLAPDWQAFASNWFTEWERTGDTKYRDYCLTGMKAVGAMTEAQVSDGTFTFDKVTKSVRPKGRNGNRHFLIIFGGDQIVQDLITNIPCPEFERAWGKLLESAVVPSRSNGYFESRMMAYVANFTGRQDLHDRALELYRGLIKVGGEDYYPERSVVIDSPMVTQHVVEKPEKSGASGVVETPGISQWAINLITAPALLNQFKATSAASAN